MVCEYSKYVSYRMWKRRRNTLPSQNTLKVCSISYHLFPFTIHSFSHPKPKIFFLDTAIMIGHVGDGNFHIFTGVDPTIDDEIRDIQSLSSKVAAKALELGGTCTGEHGIGLGKIKYFIFTCHNNANSIGGMRLEIMNCKISFRQKTIFNWRSWRKIRRSYAPNKTSFRSEKSYESWKNFLLKI